MPSRIFRPFAQLCSRPWSRWCSGAKPSWGQRSNHMCELYISCVKKVIIWCLIMKNLKSLCNNIMAKLHKYSGKYWKESKLSFLEYITGITKRPRRHRWIHSPAKRDPYAKREPTTVDQIDRSIFPLSSLSSTLLTPAIFMPVTVFLAIIVVRRL